MDPGIVTSERGARVMNKTLSLPSQLADPPVTPSITCRSCRIQVAMDAIESHECDPNDIRTMASRRSVGEMSALAAAAGKSSTAFTESLFDWNGSPSAQESVRTPESLTIDVLPTQPARLESPSTPSSPHSGFIDSPLSSPQSHSESGSPINLSRLGRSISGYLPRATTLDDGSDGGRAAPLLSRRQSAPTENRPSSSLIQCRVRGVRLTKDRVALYSILSSVVKKHGFPNSSSLGSSLLSALGTPPVNTKQEIVIERRYREFYAFALTVYAMYPSKELWLRLPPKTMCVLKDTRSGGFLLRRKNGLDDFIRCAIEMMDLGSSVQGTIGQWYLVRKFLNLPTTLLAAPTKDRSLVVALHELKKHMRETQDWTPVGRNSDHDAVFEKMCDSFQMVKRECQCAFPARAVFDMIVTHNQTNGSMPGAGVARTSEAAALLEANDPSSFVASSLPSASLLGGKAASGNSLTPWNPLVEHEEILRREDGHTWVERTTFKSTWCCRSVQLTSVKSWKVEDNGTILIVMIPADDYDCTESSSARSRVDCILGGWMIVPTPNDESCTVTWVMQANFGECDSQCEFTGSQGCSSSFVARRVLMSWADEISYLQRALEQSYVPAYYRALGPLLSGSDLQKIKLEPSDASSSLCVTEDPRVYVLARECEPSLCLLIHKNTNMNALLFKTNMRSKADLDATTPLKAEWIMFEKTGNPRQDLSALERTTTYSFATKQVGPNVHHFHLELLRRDCVLRYDPQHGFALFTTVNGKPNTRLKRVFVNYSKPSFLRLGKIEDVTLVADTELEVLVIK